MTFLILTYTFVMAAKKRNFYVEKKDSNFIVVQPNQGVQLKDRLF